MSQKQKQLNIITEAHRKVKTSNRFQMLSGGTVVWEPSVLYQTAQFGARCNVGAFCEIGNHVRVGDDTRIGGHSYIPEGVFIGKNCFVGPRVTFTNDMYPPSSRDEWKVTIVEDGASIGAGCIILPGVVIGKGALIGAGSVVTRNIPEHEIWCGNPAKYLRDRD